MREIPIDLLCSMEGKIEILVISGRLSFIQNVINYFGIKTIQKFRDKTPRKAQ